MHLMKEVEEDFIADDGFLVAHSAPHFDLIGDIHTSKDIDYGTYPNLPSTPEYYSLNLFDIDLYGEMTPVVLSLLEDREAPGTYFLTLSVGNDSTNSLPLSADNRLHGVAMFEIAYRYLYTLYDGF